MNIRIATAFILILLQTPVRASDGLERSNLAKLVLEINFLISRVDQVKKEAPEEQRVRFHYDSLKTDLYKIRSGIYDHINQTLKAGRDLKPLSGHYHGGQ
jgi:RAQPRD family integrative conjugative element protein